MAKKKWYAIKRGRKPGIYTTWPEAEAQVKGYSGAIYKGFATEEAARQWMAEEVTGTRPPKKGGTKAGTSAKKKPVPPPAGDHGLVIYTDGGALNNPGPGGYGVVLAYNDEREEISGGFRLTTNNRMELMACIVALRAVEENVAAAALYSDSSYVVNGMTKGWAKKWRKNGWMKADGKPAMNPDLWEELLRLCERIEVSFHWVKGHAGNPLNERCDQLAVAAARSDGLPPDQGYEGGL